MNQPTKGVLGITMKLGEKVAGTITLGDDPNVFAITVNDIVWRISIAADAETLTLMDADSGEQLHQQPLGPLGISYKNGRYRPGNKRRRELLMSYIVAWVLTRHQH